MTVKNCERRVSMKRKFSNLSCALSYWVVVALAGCGSGSGTSSSIPPATDAVDVVVLSNQLIRDGKQWIPHGFYQIDFEVPPAELPNQQQFWSTAQQNYTPDEYTQMKQFGANSVRIPVAQTGMYLDNTTIYSSTFHDEVLGAIKAARAEGLTVIVSVQDEQQTGDLAQNTALPSDATQRVWQAIAPVFATDRGVLFELFNEPHIRKRTTVPFPPADWHSNTPQRQV
jgi:endoglucanase